MPTLLIAAALIAARACNRWLLLRGASFWRYDSEGRDWRESLRARVRMRNLRDRQDTRRAGLFDNPIRRGKLASCLQETVVWVLSRNLSPPG
jgi:hypothetical protein